MSPETGGGAVAGRRKATGPELPKASGVEPGSELELCIDSLAAGGEGVGRHAGVVVFVPLAAPGDRLRVRVTHAKRRWLRAEIVEVLAPGPRRREPPCPYYGRCGGCDWMHLDEAEQSRARVAIVCEALRRIGGLDALPEPEHLSSPRAFGYRARARVAHARGRVGFRARGSREVVDVERCAVLETGAQGALAELRSQPPGERTETEISSYGKELRVRDQVFRMRPGAFFQPNASLWQLWQELVVGACGSGDLAVELYAGVGFYTRALEGAFTRVVAVERGRAAALLRENTRSSVVRAAAEEWAPRELARLRPQVVLLNPPREGCHRSVVDALCACEASRIVYVSCEPATLARDVGRCAGALRLVRLVVIDSLPQTHHAEVVAVLERVDSS